MQVTITEAAAALGFKSRSTLYRLLNEGKLRGWERRGPGDEMRLELEGLEGQVSRFVRVQINTPRKRAPRPSSAPAPKPEPFSIVDTLWAPLAPHINAGLQSEGFDPLSPENVLAVVRAVDDAIAIHAPEWAPESIHYWERLMADASPGDPSPDPWRCSHCGEPWHPSHPEHRRTEAEERHVAALRQRAGWGPA
jgi:hypothetical protein